MGRMKCFLLAAAVICVLAVSDQAYAQTGAGGVNGAGKVNDGYWGDPIDLPGGQTGIPHVTPDMLPMLCVDEDGDGVVDI